MSEAICAHCGAPGPIGRIRCLACGKPLLFAAPSRASLRDDAKEVFELVKAIRPLLTGKPAQVQSAALADLLAMWLAGHVIRGDQEATERLREQVLEMHLVGVRALIDINYKTSVEPQIKARTQ
jgi:hypothetical protein